MDKKLIICDIDGTIANIEHRLHYIKGPKKDWDSFTKMCVFDEPYEDVIEILDSLIHGWTWDVCCSVEREFYFFSGRSEVAREATEEWLKKHIPVIREHDNKNWELHMRKEGDFRNDVEVKREMIHSLNIKPDDVLCILDDRQGVVDMWREEGFRCLQVDAWKEEPKRHHLMDADLDDLNTAELKFLIEHERGHFNEVADRLLSTLIRTERELRKCQEGEIKPDELMGHIDVITSKIFDDTKGIETSNWRLKKENNNE